MPYMPVLPAVRSWSVSITRVSHGHTKVMQNRVANRTDLSEAAVD